MATHQTFVRIIAREVSQKLADPSVEVSGEGEQVAAAVSRAITAYSRSDAWAGSGYELHLYDPAVKQSFAVDHSAMHPYYGEAHAQACDARYYFEPYVRSLEYMCENGTVYACNQTLRSSDIVICLYVVDPLCIAWMTVLDPGCRPDAALARVLGACTRYHEYHGRPSMSYGETRLGWFWFMAMTASMHCWTCQAPSPTRLRKCGRCGVSAYCNEACQRAARGAHRERCGKAFGALPKDFVKAIVRDATYFVSKVPDARRAFDFVKRAVEESICFP